jgi:hypothetical protein
MSIIVMHGGSTFLLTIIPVKNVNPKTIYRQDKVLHEHEFHGFKMSIFCGKSKKKKKKKKKKKNRTWTIIRHLFLMERETSIMLFSLTLNFK